MMKVLTLFLALFLTLLPESVPYVNLSQGQDVCLEEVCDVEEEAVIRSSQQTLKRVQVSSEIPSAVYGPAYVEVPNHYHFCYRFERQWLMSCLLRL